MSPQHNIPNRASNVSIFDVLPSLGLVIGVIVLLVIGGNRPPGQHNNPCATEQAVTVQAGQQTAETNGVIGVLNGALLTQTDQMAEVTEWSVLVQTPNRIFVGGALEATEVFVVVRHNDTYSAVPCASVDHASRYITSLGLPQLDDRYILSFHVYNSPSR